MRMRRFDNYTPFNISLNDLYGEIFQNERLLQLKPLRTRATMDRTKYRKYHNCYGHKTEDCYDLQNAMQQLIREGHFAKHVAEQRSLHRRRTSPTREKGDKIDDKEQKGKTR